MKRFQFLALGALVALFLSFGFTTDAAAQNGKVGNNATCFVNINVGITDGFTTTALGWMLIAPNNAYYFTVPTGWWVYKLGVNGNGYVPPAPGVCIALPFLCPVALCGDSPTSWYVQ